MQICTWGTESVIEEVQIRARAGDGDEAILIPASHARAGSLMTLPDQLRKDGLEVEPHIIAGGTPSLRIRGFNKAEDVADSVEKTGLVDPSKREMVDAPSFVERTSRGAEPAGARR